MPPRRLLRLEKTVPTAGEARIVNAIRVAYASCGQQPAAPRTLVASVPPPKEVDVGTLLGSAGTLFHKCRDMDDPKGFRRRLLTT